MIIMSILYYLYKIHVEIYLRNQVKSIYESCGIENMDVCNVHVQICCAVLNCELRRPPMNLLLVCFEKTQNKLIWGATSGCVREFTLDSLKHLYKSRQMHTFTIYVYVCMYRMSSPH